MPIPDFQTIMVPLLQLAADGKEHTIREAHEHLARTFQLSEEEKAHLIPSGRQRTFYNRVSWAKIYLQQAGLLVSHRRACFSITEQGYQVLAKPPERITIKFLETFPIFVEARTVKTGLLQNLADRFPTP